MISNKKYNSTKEVLTALKDRQGGALFFNIIVNSTLDTDTTNFKTAAKIPENYKEFTISIYDSYTYTDRYILSLFINPKDFTVGEQQILSNTYTRRGWVNNAWGNQQATISASGVSAGFYFMTDNKGGITNYYRKSSPGFINLIDVVALFKNNGWYFLDGVSNPSLFKDGTSRVINVMDSIKIEYDGSTYIGSFSTFTLNDVATSPYKIDYSFEFIVSSFGLNYNSIDGHIAIDDNYKDDQVHLAIQGSNVGFKTILGLDENELNRYFPADEVPDPTTYDYNQREANNEADFFNREDEKNVAPIGDGIFRITRGWRDGEPHGQPNMKCDFRTHTGTIYSATDGVVYKVKRSPIYGGSNYIIITTVFSGTPLYIRYFHLDINSIRLVEGMNVSIGTIVGREGTDNGRYPQHCDFGARIINSSNPNYLDCQEFQVNPILDKMWRILHQKSIGDNADPIFKQDFLKLIAKHSSPGVTANIDITNTVR